MCVWNDKAFLMIVQVKLPSQRRFVIPVSLWVVDQLIKAVADLGRIGDAVIKVVPLPEGEKDEAGRQALRYLKGASIGDLIEGLCEVMKDLRRYKGTNIVDVTVKDIEVKVQLK